jgi:cytochrome c biogenesis protein CcdA
MKGTHVLLVSGLLFLAAVFVVGIYIVPRAQAGSPATARQSDAGRVRISDVYLDVTYATPDFVKRVKLEPYLSQYQGRTQPFLIGINTHVGSIEHIDLRGKVFLEDNHGDRYPSLGAPVVVSEHHNLYLVVLPLLDNHGQPIFAVNRDHFRLLISGVGKIPERVFDWKLPVVEPAPARTLANTLILALSVIGALMVILSPCAIELTTYYTGIIAGVVSSAVTATPASGPPQGFPGAPASTGARGALPPHLRGRILQNLAGFVAGFTLLYMASGATVAWLGHSLMSGEGAVARQIQPFIDAICGPNPNAVPPARLARVGLPATTAIMPENSAAMPAHERNGHMAHSLFGGWAHYANLLGAAFLVFFALKSVGLFKRHAACFVWLGQLGRKFRFGLAAVVALVSPKRAEIIRRPCVAMREPQNITPLNSFCAGLGLSVSCLTCMGGAILYPMLIFVGTSTWYLGALILGTYSLALAVPMAAIAVSIGDFTWKYAHRPWLNRSLQWTSAVMMILVAVLIAFDRTRFINTVVFTLLNTVGGNPDPALAQL